MVLDAATCVAMVASFKLSIKRTAASRPPVSSKEITPQVLPSFMYF